jgi:hypothetical protein
MELLNSAVHYDGADHIWLYKLKLTKDKKIKLRMVVHSYNPNTQQAEAI